MPKPTIINLKANPAFFDTVANRIWKEWWERKGKTEEDVRQGLRGVLDGEPFYDGFVAVQNEVYLGSALVIKSDMTARPDYTPWIAAVYVEEEHRGQGIGAALIEHAAQSTFKHHAPNVYLCASKTNAPYYTKLGWDMIEEDVGDDCLTVFSKQNRSFCAQPNKA